MRKPKFQLHEISQDENYTLLEINENNIFDLLIDMQIYYKALLNGYIESRELEGGDNLRKTKRNKIRNGMLSELTRVEKWIKQTEIEILKIKIKNEVQSEKI